MVRSAYTEVAQIEILLGNLIHVTMKNGAEVELEQARNLVRTINSQLDNDDIFRGGVFDITGLTYVNAEARNYLSSGEDANGITVGIALVSTSFLGRTIGNMFINLSGICERFPVQYFDSPIRAEHWVRTLMRIAREENDSSKKKVA
ncbi:MAG: hypothetical protein GC178_10700 [Flavobacteriales bacterium]|nr:hypothetical protein [Flavobacteriales bacterium]